MTDNKSVKTVQNPPCGGWPSPISSDAIIEGSTSIDELRAFRGALCWIERRPTEGGRCVIVRHQNEEIQDILPPPWSCRSRVHEYGGGSYCLTDSGIYFVNDRDQNIYHLSGSDVTCIIDAPEKRFADLVYDHMRDRLVCVCEDHGTVQHEPVNTLVAIDSREGSMQTLSEGHDFYSDPCHSNDGSQLAWLCWNHPDMPWDRTQLWLADITASGILENQRCIINSKNVSVFQPRWSPDNILYYVSDETGWWNLYRYINDATEPVTRERLEFGLPQWVFGLSNYVFIDDHTILAGYIDNGHHHLAYIDIPGKVIRPINRDRASFSSIQYSDGHCYFIEQSKTETPLIIKLPVTDHGAISVTKPRKLPFSRGYLSTGETISFTTRHDDTAYAIYYAPKNPDYSVGSNEKPPLIVITHGGPTAASHAGFDARKQFWTSRGFAIIDVNYSGSTGFGRDYRQRLNGNWGVRDAEDCCDAALYMVEQGLADADKLIIRGSSAGGYTVLCALTFHDVFSAGASYYGISELETLVNDTHKFEARYLDRLVGPYPQALDIYKQRSPIYHVDQLSCPVIFFQGLDDRVVPKQQAEKMVAALERKGIPVTYIEFEGEQHGFRKAETIKKCLDAELGFYATVLGIPVKDKIPLDIKNID